MGRGVSSSRGQSSLGYLFGSSDVPRPDANNSDVPVHQVPLASNDPSQMSDVSAVPPLDIKKQIPAGIPRNTPNNANNYFRAEGQNCGNFITDRPSTKVHTAPGGRSSLDYLFGGRGN